MQAIAYKSSDGLEIPAYLTLPKGVPAKDLPTVVVPHGGPWARDTWGYNPIAQFLANRGYAVLHAQFPRLHRLRQEVPQRGQRRVGRARCRTTSPGA